MSALRSGSSASAVPGVFIATISTSALRSWEASVST
jgi:hypothetical protein